MDGHKRSLEGIVLLQALPPERRTAVAARCRWRRHEAGEVIFARGDRGEDVLFISEGEVGIVDFAASGREVSYAVARTGGHVGELSAIDGLPRSATIVALKACTLAALPAPDFIRLVEGEAALCRALLTHLARIVRASDERITELSTTGAMQRVYRLLLREAVPAEGGGGQRFVVRDLPTQETLAARLGTTRETVARALSQLARGGIVRRQGRTLLIQDRMRLEALADPAGDEG